MSLNTSMPPAPIAGSWNTRIGIPPTRRRRKSRPSTKPTGIVQDVEGKWDNHQQKEGETEMETKLKSDWTVELAEYMYVRYGIDICETICNEVQTSIQNENQKDGEKRK